MNLRDDRTWTSLMPPELQDVRDPKQRKILVYCFIVAGLLSVLTTIAVGGIVFGCAAVKESCDVIHVADDVCHVVAVKNASGQTVTLPVAEDDIRTLAARAAARNGVQLPPGAQGAPTSFSTASAAPSSSAAPVGSR